MPVTCPAKALIVDADYRHTGVFFCLVPAEHTIQDVKMPEYFGMVAARAGLRVNDRITVRSQDASYFLDLLVRAVFPGVSQVHTAVIHERVFTGDADLPEGYEIAWRGADGMYVIIHNGRDVEAGLPTRDAAQIRAGVLAGVQLQAAKQAHVEKQPATPAKKKTQTEAKLEV
jgi:hypothetical protein